MPAWSSPHLIWRSEYFTARKWPNDQRPGARDATMSSPSSTSARPAPAYELGLNSEIQRSHTRITSEPFCMITVFAKQAVTTIATVSHRMREIATFSRKIVIAVKSNVTANRPPSLDSSKFQNSKAPRSQAQTAVRCSDLVRQSNAHHSKISAQRRPTRRAGRDETPSNLPAKHAKHSKRICVHRRASAVKKSFARLNLCSPPNDRTERQPPRRGDARDFRPPERAAEARDSRTAKRGGCSLQ